MGKKRQKKTDRRPSRVSLACSWDPWWIDGRMEAAREAHALQSTAGKLGVRGLLVYVPFGRWLCLLLQPWPVRS